MMLSYRKMSMLAKPRTQHSVHPANERRGRKSRTAGGLRVLSLIQARNLVPFRWLALPAALIRVLRDR